MNIILLERIDNLGDLGDKVNVRAGYARNYLIPGGKAKYATKENIAEFEERRAELEAAAAGSLTAAQSRHAKINELEMTIAANAGPEGKLFGSVGTIELAAAITAAGNEVEKSEVRLPDGPFHETGEFEVTIHLHADVDAIVKVIVVAEEA